MPTTQEMNEARLQKDLEQIKKRRGRPSKNLSSNQPVVTPEKQVETLDDSNSIGRKLAIKFKELLQIKKLPNQTLNDWTREFESLLTDSEDTPKMISAVIKHTLEENDFWMDKISTPELFVKKYLLLRTQFIQNNKKKKLEQDRSDHTFIP